MLALQSVIDAAWYAAHPKHALARVKKSLSVNPKLDSPTGWPAVGSYTGKPVNDLTPLQVTAAWAAIRLISETIGTLPLHLYRRTPRGRERAEEHNLYWLMKLKPNRFMNAVEVRESLAVSLCIYGHAYAKLDKNGTRFASIIPLDKRTVMAERVKGEILYRVSEDGQQTIYPADQILSIKGFGGAGELEGYAPYHFHKQALGLALAAEEYGARFFGNGARPSGFLTIDQILKPEQREQFKKTFQGMHSGLENSNTLALLEAGMKYEKVTSANNEAQFIETRKFQIDEIARIWRVPPHMLMEMGRATFNNIEQQNISFIQSSLQPYLVRIESTLNTTLLNDTEQRQLYFEFDVRGLLRGDSKSRSEYYRNMRMIAGMTPNEVRTAENLPTQDGGDDLHVPLNMAPIDQLREILGDDNGNEDNSA